MLAKYNQSFLEIARAAVEQYNIDSTRITLGEAVAVLAQLPRPSEEATKVGLYCFHVDP